MSLQSLRIYRGSCSFAWYLRWWLDWLSMQSGGPLGWRQQPRSRSRRSVKARWSMPDIWCEDTKPWAIVSNYSQRLEKIESYQSMMTKTIINNIKETMIMTKLSISFSRVVLPVLGWLVSFAIRPKTVLSPVATTTPIPVPDMQCVPCMPMQCVSR